MLSCNVLFEHMHARLRGPKLTSSCINTSETCETEQLLLQKNGPLCGNNEKFEVHFLKGHGLVTLGILVGEMMGDDGNGLDGWGRASSCADTTQPLLSFRTPDA